MHLHLVFVTVSRRLNNDVVKIYFVTAFYKMNIILRGKICTLLEQKAVNDYSMWNDFPIQLYEFNAIK